MANAINKVITPTPTANAVPLFDASANLSGNNVIGGFATTVRSFSSNYTLTIASAENQQFTGLAGADQVLLPLTTTLVAGISYTIINNSSGALTVKDSTNTNIIYSIPAAYAVTFICVLNSGATAASWYVAQPFRPVVEGTFVPTFTFSNVGDLSVAYTTQTGFYRQRPTPTGSLVWMYGICQFTPTFSTSSGQARLMLTTPPNNISPSNGYILLADAGGVNFGTGNTYSFLQGAGSTPIFTICAWGSNKAPGSLNLAPANFTTGAAVSLQWEGWYRSY